MKATSTCFHQKKRQLYNKRAKVTKMVKEILSDEDFSDSDDEVTAMINALKQHGLFNRLKLKIDSQQHKCGRKLLSLEIRKRVWNFWNDQSSPSTNTSRPAKLRLDSKPKIQLDLNFHNGVIVTENKRKAKMYQSCWLLTNQP